MKNAQEILGRNKNKVPCTSSFFDFLDQGEANMNTSLFSQQKEKIYMDTSGMTGNPKQ
jgi:hypothetical protein